MMVSPEALSGFPDSHSYWHPRFMLVIAIGIPTRTLASRHYSHSIVKLHSGEASRTIGKIPPTATGSRYVDRDSRFVEISNCCQGVFNARCESPRHVRRVSIHAGTVHIDLGAQINSRMDEFGTRAAVGAGNQDG
jgi:hypothetical protein